MEKLYVLPKTGTGVLLSEIALVASCKSLHPTAWEDAREAYVKIIFKRSRDNSELIPCTSLEEADHLRDVIIAAVNEEAIRQRAVAARRAAVQEVDNRNFGPRRDIPIS